MPYSSVTPVADSVQSIDTTAGVAQRFSNWRPALSLVMCSSWLINSFSHIPRLNPDGISYVDIASACLKGNWASLVNAYWSPAYPFLLSVWLSLFRPSAFWEAWTVRCFNCLCLAAALWCFEYFLNGLLECREVAAGSERKNPPLPPSALKAIGYVLFFWTSIFMTPPFLVTPDILVVIVVLLSGGIILRIRCGAENLLRFAALGLVLGLGYLAKAAMFPIAICFLLASLFAVRNLGRAIPKLLVAGFIFVVISAPYALALSRSKGRFTLGESGTLNYAEFVNGATRSIHWQGQPSDTGTPKHPTRQALDRPLVYEYAEPIGGSYPPWTDPSYWYEGIRPHFNLKQQLRTVRDSLERYYNIFSRLAGISAAFIVLLVWSRDYRGFIDNLWKESFLWAPAMAALAIYGLVLVERRYVSGFIILLWAGLFSALRISPTEAGRALIRSVTVAVIFLLSLPIVGSVAHSSLQFRSQSFQDWELAQELGRDGVGPGSRVAFIGAAAWDHYWAHLAEVSVVSEAADEGANGFWAASPELKARVISVFNQVGAKVVVARDVPQIFLADGWQLMPHTNYYVLRLSDHR